LYLNQNKPIISVSVIFSVYCHLNTYFYETAMMMSKTIAPRKIQHIHSTGELGCYLRDSRREQGVTISNASAFVSLGERFISEIERGKETAFLDKTLQN
jgi:hypothetical protein